MEGNRSTHEPHHHASRTHGTHRDDGSPPPGEGGSAGAHTPEAHPHEAHTLEAHPHEAHPHQVHAPDGQDHGHHAHTAAGLRHRLAHLITPHHHEPADKVDAAMETSREGMRTLWTSLAVLGATALFQALIAALSGSVALLGDTVHNAADALTAVPLGIALLLGRRAANRRYTYGYGRAEDLAGVLVVAVIAVSAALAAWAAADRLLSPREVTHLWAVAAAALTGFAGNEWVARHRIRTGRRIGSAALVADGLHARADGFTSLAVLLGAAGSALGLPAADPVVGLLITLAILLVLVSAAREVCRRLMDCVDPALVDTAEGALRAVDGVLDVGQLRMRWIGHALRAEADIVVGPHLTVVQAHGLAVAAESALIRAVPRLTAATVHTDHTHAHPERAVRTGVSR
ncbi:cation diffusion facilitator family transporter [Streptomyces sp. 3211.6]|uniref:cation diffusion facilitator family transporter n=1 Tax=Streptomyces sp. 3211.6 TaxID=1938845 RepID=UPI000F201C0A|nr:cation diffusion facilitator family transporter [Streptomyces sp. 3211.6]RKT02616.1 cation diffusion facilitator family transporter [Streptomyces sp. 3211.6]